MYDVASSFSGSFQHFRALCSSNVCVYVLYTMSAQRYVFWTITISLTAEEAVITPSRHFCRVSAVTHKTQTVMGQTVSHVTLGTCSTPHILIFTHLSLFPHH